MLVFRFVVEQKPIEYLDMEFKLSIQVDTLRSDFETLSQAFDHFLTISELKK